ncbi:MAG: hypothetical protein AAGC74_04940 [Verrucomicrobiota bacterium]
MSFFLFLILPTFGQEEREASEDSKPIIEITTFGIKSDVDAGAFAKRDSQVEADFTAKQSGFIKRQSGVSEEGDYVVMVYWKSLPDAEASIKKFMGDASVADYAQMIDGPTMKMARFTTDVPFSADKPKFVEVMSFDLVQNTDLKEFSELNKSVETDFTSKREGFLQRLTASNEEGKQAVVVYWESKETSDASLQPFMAAPISKQFMSKMDQSSISMGRYSLLKAEE